MLIQLFSLSHVVNAHLRDIVFYLVCAVSLLVFATSITAMVIFQKSKAHFGMELIWTVIPFVMLFVILIPVINLYINQ